MKDKKEKNLTNANKKNIKKILNLTIFIIFLLGILVGSFFAVYKSTVDRYDITYKGGFGLNIAVQTETFDPNTDLPNYSNPGETQSISILKNKLDPLGNKNFYFSIWKEESNDLKSITFVNVQTAKSTYDNNLNNFISESERPGFLYFTDATGKDLLINNDNRTPVTKVLSSASSSVDKNNQNSPIIQLNVLDTDTWNNTIIKGSNNNLFIWTDLAYFVNDLRNINKLSQFDSLFNILNPLNVDIKSIFDFTYENSITRHNLWDDYLRNLTNPNNDAFTKELEATKNWIITTSGSSTSLDAGMNSNDPKNVSNKYIDAFRPSLASIISNQSININHEFDKYLLDEDKNPKPIDTSNGNSVYNISVESNSDAKKAANLINGGLHGIVFSVVYSYVIPSAISDMKFKISLIIFIIFILAVIIFLITYYRLFGFICSLGIILTLAISYMLIGLLLIEIGPPLILSLLIILFLNIDSNIHFFEHFKREYYVQNVANTKSFKLANKKTFLSIVDYHLILLILGLVLFSFSSNSLKMFSISLIILCLVSFIIYVFITKMLYYWIIKSKWLDNSKILQIPNFLFFKNKKLSIEKNTNQVVNNNDSLSNDVDNIKNKLDKNKKPAVFAKIKNSFNKTININSNNKIQKQFSIRILFVSLISVLIIISCLLFGINGARNGEQTLSHNHPGTTIKLYDVNENNINVDQNELNKLIKEKYHNKMDFTIYLINPVNQVDGQSLSQYNLLLTTNLKYDSKLQIDVIQWLKSSELPDKYNLNFQTIDYFKTTSSSYQELIKQFFIVVGFIILAILIYMMIRFNWTQFLAVLGALCFTVIMVITFINFSYVWITLDMFLALLGVAIYVIVEGVFVSSKIKYEKLKYNKENYKPIFNLYIKYKLELKKIKLYAKNEYKNELEKIVISDIEFSNNEFKSKKQELKKIIKINLKQKKQELKQIKNEFKNEFKNSDANYLLDLKKYLIKDSIKRAVITSIIFSIITILLIIFGGLPIGFGLIILIGINISIFSSIFIFIEIWLFIERYNILHSLKINTYLMDHTLELDEENVLGINM